MITFKLFASGLYLADATKPAKARVGFMFQDDKRTDPTFQLSQATWTDPSQQGYFAFFVPSATRDWDVFARGARRLFQKTKLAQFAWLDEAPDSIAVSGQILVINQGTKTPIVSEPFPLVFKSVILSVEANLSQPSLISFDDSSNAFLFDNSRDVVQLTSHPPNHPQAMFRSTSANLVLPMNDATNVHAGSVNADFDLTAGQLTASFEAGFMYFGLGTDGGPLAALHYPLLRAATPLKIGAWLDVLQPRVDTRSYFQLKDGTIGSYFTAANGKSFAFTTVNGADPSSSSRLAFANRVVDDPSEEAKFYYLTPAGSFGLSLDGATSASLLCGITGTEFLSLQTTTDTLVMQSGQPAFQKTTPGTSPAFLDSIGGNVTTSWVQFVSKTGSYVSQPQDSPLYTQSGGSGDQSEPIAYILGFLPLPAWRASAPSPLVPMVPYSGLTFDFPGGSEPYVEMESTALNPTRKNAFTAATASAKKFAPTPLTATGDLTPAMTPQGLLAKLDANQVWRTTQIARSPSESLEPDSGILQFTEMGDAIREALQQNQIFLVISSLTDAGGNPLFSFAGEKQTITIAGWPFSLSPAGTPSSDDTPPILILKFFPGQSIKDLVDDISLWSQAGTFNSSPKFGPTQAKKYIQGVIQEACEAVYGEGNCPDGEPTGKPDTSSLYWNFYQVVTDRNFSGLLALNANMQLDNLPTAIKAVTGGMTKPGTNPPQSNIDAFRVHHVGIAISDSNPKSKTPELAQSSFFGLIDYETAPTGHQKVAAADSPAGYLFEVQHLRALFSNSSLSSFACTVNLTINQLFGTNVSKGGDNKVVITGSYQAHSTSGDKTTSGEGIYSFVTENTYTFAFKDSPYLDNITLTKLQFSFQQETKDPTNPKKSNIQAGFGIWGFMKFKELNLLDIFSFKQLTFDDLGISVSFDLTVDPPKSPSTANLKLDFNPGNLRLDLAHSPAKEGKKSLLSLLPLKLTSFLYNQHPDQQKLEDLQYYSLSKIPLDPGFSLTNQFNYGLTFDLDLGTLGALVGSLQAFKFSFLIGWLEPGQGTPGGIAFGIQLPQSDGKLRIKIQGVLDLIIEQFILRYETPEGSDTAMLVLALHNSSIQILGQRLPPGTAQFDLAIFAPAKDAARIGWIAAINNEKKLPAVAGDAALVSDAAAGSVFRLGYLGLGQRTGPDPSSAPTTFQSFLNYMTNDFWTAIENRQYDSVYHPTSQWLAITDFRLLEKIQVGFIFYDATPFYSLTLHVDKLFDFEITYTKVSDSIGLFYAELTLPDALRTFNVGAAAVTLPSLAASIYTNGDWKIDLGFPNGEDWSRCFQVQAQAGPVPITGSGGFYIASLSSATFSIFTGQYPSILAFGLAARLGIGKSFTAGPLKAGVSLTFFGIVQGAAGYLASGSDNIFKSPDAISLQGQFGVIGELYGSIDFVIIKASVNVRLQASIGIVLKYERTIPNSGSILLYIEASVSVSVSVKINLFLFSIRISFSFRASFRFEWQLLAPGAHNELLETQRLLHQNRALLKAAAAAVLPLIPGFSTSLPIWYLPEGTVVFPASTGTGTPWVVSSLGVEYDNNFKVTPPDYSKFKAFEQVTTQLATWAVGQALGVTGWDFNITKPQLQALDQDPVLLVGGIDYGTLLSQLAVFSSSTVALPQAADGATLHAATFPMLPFFRIQTDGRLNGTDADDLDYIFSTKNNVSTTYIITVDAYFNQLFVNQEGGSSAGALTATLLTETTIPLIQEIFLNYFTGLIRGAVHQLLETIQNLGKAQEKIDALFKKAFSDGLLAALSGQMSSSFRGGARLPFTAGLTVPGGDALDTTNPEYALLWQEFPVGSLGDSGMYTIALSNADSTQTWITSTAKWELKKDWLTPLQQAQATDIVPPTAPVQLPFTGVGPQAFPFENPVPWTQPGSTKPVSLRPFASALETLQSAQSVDVALLVESRPAGAPYMPGGTLLAPSAFGWATQITLNIQQVADNKGTPLPDIFALTGASQSDQLLLEQLLKVLQSEKPIASIQVLYQLESGTTGLVSDAIKPADVFALRTNTTTVSSPPRGRLMKFSAEEAASATVPVGAQIDDHARFLQIIQQAAVTNATGYYLRYLNSSGKSLPPALFSGGPAPVTILITYLPTGEQNTPASPSRVRPFYNSIVLNSADPALVYYGETTNPALSIQYGTVAAGSIGAILTRDDSVMLMTASQPLLSALGSNAPRLCDRGDMIAAIVQSGVTDEAQLQSLLAASGGTATQLNELYSLITYQVEATDGFIQSNLSAPIQPQQPDAQSSLADGLADVAGTTRSYRVYVPLYKLAANNPSLNRYASIGSPIDVEFFQNDAFGNQMPGQLSFSGATNLYFDPIVPLDQWKGVVTNYDFNPAGPAANTFNIYLTPSERAFAGLTPEQIATALQTWTKIADQITAPGISFVVETNLALQSDGSMVQVTLTQDQAAAITSMAAAIVAYLRGTGAFPAAPVVLSLTVAGDGALPPAFEIAVLFQIQRDKSLISPLLKDNSGNITFPSAQCATTTVVSTVGKSVEGGKSVSVTEFAAAFVQAFPQLVLSVGLNGAKSSSQTSNAQTSSVSRRRETLRKAAVASDGSNSGESAQSLWAVQRPLLDITIGGEGAGPYYLSPEPLDNTLNSATVPLPALPDSLRPKNWPASQLFTDIDLDLLNSNFFAAVDGFLAPGSAAKAFEVARAAYDSVAKGRGTLANLYSTKEIDWLFDAKAPFTGTPAQLQAAQTTFEQQMRAALATAYTTDTLVQYGVTWGTLPDGVGDSYALYGTLAAKGGGDLPKGFTFSAPTVPITPNAQGLLTFLFGVPDIRDTAMATLDLAYNVSHLEVFLVPADQVPKGEARPSMWLQLVDPYATLPPLGTSPTEIPLVFREYPTPPTVITQQATQGSSQPPSDNPLLDAAAWHLTYAYQVPITVHDIINSAITYNTNLMASGGGDGSTLFAATANQAFTLFQSLARFSATFPVLLPVLTSTAHPAWADAAAVFADLVAGVVTNTTWTPPPALALGVGRSLPNITDEYTITDTKQEGEETRLITFTWASQESSFTGVKLSIEALRPATLEPYPDQHSEPIDHGIIDSYTPEPPLESGWVVHQIEADNLNVLFAENALAGVQLERNLIKMTAPDGSTFVSKPEYVYMTPIVRATQPITPLVDNLVPIDITTLPPQTGSGCPSTPPGVFNLCQRIYTLMFDLLADTSAQQTLVAAQLSAGLDAGTPRRVKAACSFQYPVVPETPIAPLVPIALARSFIIDGSQPAQLSEFSNLYAAAIATWASNNGVVFGSNAQKGAQLVFDITLFAQLSGLNTPLLRLRNLQLKLTDFVS